MQADKLIPGNKGIKDVAPDVVEGSSQKIQQRRAPGVGNYGGGTLARGHFFLGNPSTLLGDMSVIMM